MEGDVYYNTEETANWSGRLSSSQLCRICANPNGYLIPIFEGEGLDHELGMKIQKHLPIQVSAEDNLPKQMCYQCASTLISWHDLVISCLEADRKIRNLQKQEQEDEDEDDDAEDDKVIEAFDDPIKKSDTAGEEIIEPGTSLKLLSEVQTQSGVEKDQLTSNENHLENTEAKTVAVKCPSQVTSPQQEISKSPKSSEITNIQESTSQQELIPSERYRQRPLTPFYDFQQVIYTPSSESSSRSISEIRDTVPLTKIRELLDRDICIEIIKREDNLAHCGSERPIYECAHCGKILSSRENMRIHLRLHTGERPFTCHICGKQFQAQSGIKRHLKEVHEGVRDQICDICGRGFANKRTLEDHRRIHTGERPYVCDLCGKTFKTKASLYVHKKSHTDIFPFQCSSCGKRFRAQTSLTLHILKHTGEKPHVCDVCGKGFRIKYELGKHKLIHSDGKPFACDECGHAFRQLKYLRNHKRTRHLKDG